MLKTRGLRDHLVQCLITDGKIKVQRNKAKTYLFSKESEKGLGPKLEPLCSNSSANIF